MTRREAEALLARILETEDGVDDAIEALERGELPPCPTVGTIRDVLAWAAEAAPEQIRELERALGAD